ncbi:MAG TPA: CDP-diacylglycerol--glycerol-3-phosphate 3-phosphatidyltransferase [Rhodothermales bacterium]|nr:CDP-diacylglycerol--glycerol-3-phosphate 3-phosphatidyltransferase [Rhodothermales bacterium]HRR07069.1 CDP-diacylglycerol--glycerol-3-phosphate 3-phosphatidyltransferase [Rhodothermales bacterium]
MTKKLPNFLSISRIVLTPLFIWLILTPTLEKRLLGGMVFIIAGLSDYWDGKLARQWKAKSRFGQFLDPLADKIFVLGTFAVLPFLVPEIPWWFVVVIGIRDLSVTALRSWAEVQSTSIPTSYSAKVKTTIQFVYLGWVLVWLICTHIPSISSISKYLLTQWPMLLLMWITLLFTVITGLQYAQYALNPSPSQESSL